MKRQWKQFAAMVLVGLAAGCLEPATEPALGESSEALTSATSTVGLLYGDGYVEWKSTAGNTFVGFSRTDANQNYNTIDYGFHVSAGNNLCVYENGVYRHCWGPGSVGPNDTLRIEVIGGTVYYHKNNWQLYLMSYNVATFPLIVDTAFYQGGDKVSNVVLSRDGGPAVPVTTWRKARGVDIVANNLTATGIDNYSVGWGLHGASAAMGGVNYAAKSNGGFAVSSSLLNSWHRLENVNDGNRAGYDRPNETFGWWNAQPSASCYNGSEWVYIALGATRTIREIDVFSVQNNYTAPVDPTGTTSVSAYGLKDFRVQYYTGPGGQFVDVPNGNITNNTRAWRKITFPPLQTQYVRVLLMCNQDTYGRVVEVEAWGDLPSCSSCTTQDSCGPDARCVDANDVTTTCNAYGVCDRGSCAQACSIANVSCDKTCTAGMGYPTNCASMGYSCSNAETVFPTGVVEYFPPCSETCTSTSKIHNKCQNGVNTITCGAYGVYEPQPVKGLVTYTATASANRCLNLPVVQVNAIHGDNFMGQPMRMAYNQSAHPNPELWWHWQGVQRLQLNPNRFVMSLSINPDDTAPSFGHGAIVVGDQIAPSGSHGWTVLEATSHTFETGNRMNHPGGIQTLGNYAVVPMTHAYYSGPSIYSGPDTSIVRTFNVNNGSSMPVGGTLTMSGTSHASAAGIVALAPFPGESGGRHLLAVANSGYMYMYLSPPGSWQNNPGYIDNWTFVAAPPYNEEDRDNFNFVTDCTTGDIYIIGIGRTGNAGRHWLNLQLLENAMFNPITDGIQGATISVNHVNKDLDCTAITGGTAPNYQTDAYCAFNAAGGAYVDENNQLSIYATEHDNDGENNSVKMMKFSNTWTIP